MHVAFFWKSRSILDLQLLNKKSIVCYRFSCLFMDGVMDYLRKDIQGKPKIIELVPYDSHWPVLFEQEATVIKQVLGKNCVSIHHFGSTSIPGLPSKPVIDIIAEVHSFSLLDVTTFGQLGFEFKGEVILSGRYFSKKSPRVHLHIFEKDNHLIKRNLDFRDWLRTHDDDRDAYSMLKEQLAALHKNGVSYTRAKTEFIDAILTKSMSI